MVNGPSPGPAPAAQARASSSRLTRSSWRTWPHRKLRRKVPRVERLHRAADGAGRSAGAQHVGVVNAVATGQRRRHQGHHLVASVGSARGAAQVNVAVNQLGHDPGNRQQQPSIGHQAHRRQRGCGRGAQVKHLIGAPGRRWFSVSKTISPRAGSILPLQHTATLISSHQETDPDR